MVKDHFYGEPDAQQAYQPLGNFSRLNFGVSGYFIKDYYRELDTKTGNNAKSVIWMGDVKVTGPKLFYLASHACMVMKFQPTNRVEYFR